ncbi:Tryptophan synthase beta subunit-like PLP-dependent enzyme [Glarea lozoyensis ATCC 20868]|uniref:Cysteine synthase 2 n=1 Tax=Glarea lozoyensis (strain ATCC 20868 / MF5171) TaxID=1116229 RepID=S3DCV0_GLAL2|nr:Tryptophan synthase beta subunit-like PLP-dependent enzyme [Glarea lozoyensis ATCC 20868]EPE24523.1 Tryptophan synthase beta subunit-like PLP-dependent enzyme [Glarea lozoyensis ATCC 20868]
MSMTNHPKAYGSAAVAIAFVAGILATLGFKDFYPDLERRYQRRRGQPYNPADSRPGSTYLAAAPLSLEDHSKSARNSRSSLPAPPIPEGIEGCIGNTPLFKIRSLSEATGCLILAKAEFLNGAGNSPKDRVALNMIKMAEEEGLLTPGQGDTIYEGTVGSTGISLATLARAKGYKAYICMPNDQSTEKSDLLTHLGATVERVTPAPITSTEHFVNLARTRAKEHTNSSGTSSKGFFADQFESGANYKAHLQTTGPEIWQQTGGHVDAFVAGAGTGGTISGVALYLKQNMGMSNELKVVLADPEGSGLYNKVKNGVMFSNTEREGTRRRQQVDTIVEGIGLNRLTENFEAGRELIDDAVKVTDIQAFKMARWLVEKDGIFVGSSSAVNCVAAVATALQMPKGSRVVTILCDSGTRHLSKFWKKVGEAGLEEGHDQDDLIELLSLK